MEVILTAEEKSQKVTKCKLVFLLISIKIYVSIAKKNTRGPPLGCNTLSNDTNNYQNGTTEQRVMLVKTKNTQRIKNPLRFFRLLIMMNTCE